MTKGLSSKLFFIIVACALAYATFFILTKGFPTGLSYSVETQQTATQTPAVIKTLPEAKHIPTPDAVKAVYMTSHAASTQSFRTHLIKLLDETELNAIVIDIKDYSGTISFPIEDKAVSQYGASENRIPDIREFIELLHNKNVYVIGRITVFQDPHLAKARPDIAVQSKATGGTWKDRKGIAFIDVSAKDAWDYHIALAKESYKLGFDEINFDYIRFPSDGNIADMKFPVSGNVTATASTTPKADALEKFFKYLHTEIKKDKKHPVISADLFGMVTTNTDDLGIGQVLERAIPYFDYIAPMVYPSHYPATFLGYKNPAEHPYEVIEYAMGSAVKRLNAASTTPLKLRPWIQDFNLGATYDAEKVRAQIKATYDVGLTSWMLWDPKNQYTRGALLPE
jgi:hypothetical protein